jgi:integrase
MKRRPGRPRALSTAGAVYARVELDDRHDPPPGKDWVHLDFQPDEKSPFPVETLVRHFTLAKKLAGITRRFRFHDCRHTFASRLASRGVSLQVIQKALGHTSARMSERYARPDEHALATIRTALDSAKMDTSMDTQEKIGAAGPGVSAGNSLTPPGLLMERDTRVELATSTLAR